MGFWVWGFGVWGKQEKQTDMKKNKKKQKEEKKKNKKRKTKKKKKKKKKKKTREPQSVRLRPISTSANFDSANFDFGQFRLRPIRFRPAVELAEVEHPRSPGGLLGAPGGLRRVGPRRVEPSRVGKGLSWSGLSWVIFFFWHLVKKQIGLRQLAFFLDIVKKKMAQLTIGPSSTKPTHCVLWQVPQLLKGGRGSKVRCKNGSTTSLARQHALPQPHVAS